MTRAGWFIVRNGAAIILTVGILIWAVAPLVVDYVKGRP
jgi:hypothetical protein